MEMRWGLLIMVIATAMPPALGAEAPFLSDEQLLQSLDLQQPGLQKVFKAFKAGDTAGARTALAGYFRARTGEHWWFDPHRVDRAVSFNRAEADRTAADTLQSIGIAHSFPDGVDWLFTPTGKDGLPLNYEWQWQLGRMYFWGNLGRAYWATGDEKYAQAFVRQLRSWASQCPRPDDNGNKPGSPWRTIEAGLRMSASWPDAYHRFLSSPTFGDDDLILMLKLFAEHAEHLRQHHVQGGNWLTMEMAGLYSVGAVFPEFRSAEAWRRYAIDISFRELTRQFQPDGSQIELTPGYHWVALNHLIELPQLARQVGLAGELPAGFVARSERAFEYQLMLMAPDRRSPALNDSSRVEVPSVLKLGSELFPQRADFRWAAGGGREGAPPTRTSVALTWAGQYVMRSGWERDANYLCLDAGPLSAGHSHQDKLSVAVWSYGREMLFDDGGGTYEKSKWRQYAVDTQAHNTVLVDGLAQRRGAGGIEPVVSDKPLDNPWMSNAQYDFAAGSYADAYGKTGNRPATHHRRVLFVKPDLFIVADTLVPNDTQSHTYEARWHLATTRTKTDPATHAVVTLDDGQPNLAVVPLLTEKLDLQVASEQEQPEILGWHFNHDGQRVPATTVRHALQGNGMANFLTLLAPLKAQATNPVIAVRQTGPAAAEVALSDCRTWRVTVDPQPGGVMKFMEILPDGQSGRMIETGKPQ